MDGLINFISADMEWVFSGVGVAILSFLVGYIQVRVRKRNIETNNITSRGKLRIQMSKDISHGFVVGNKSDIEIIKYFKEMSNESNESGTKKTNKSKHSDS